MIGRVSAAVGLVLTAVWASSFLIGPAVPLLADGAAATAAFTAYGVWFLWLGAVGLGLLRQRPSRPDTSEPATAGVA